MTHSAAALAEPAPAPQDAPGAVCVVVGTRPEIVKMAPVVDELRSSSAVTDVLVTGQHTTLLEGMPSLGQTRSLGVVSRGAVAEFVTRARAALEADFAAKRPAVVVVQGDTMSAYAATIAASTVGIPVAHVEAGVRSGDAGEPWPEETLRQQIDEIATWRYAPTSHCLANLRSEGHNGLMTGNTVVDAMARYTDARPHTETGATVLVTLHRREFYTHASAGGVLDALVEGARLHPGVTFVWPIHPALDELAAAALADAPDNIRPCDPVPYTVLVDMIAGARGVLTDSGGVTEEAATLGVPIVMLRRVTDRPEAVAAGIALRLDPVPDMTIHATRVLAQAVIPRMANGTAIYGDGKAASRIVTHLTAALGTRMLRA